jgi:hypothetical protein
MTDQTRTHAAAEPDAPLPMADAPEGTYGNGFFADMSGINSSVGSAMTSDGLPIVVLTHLEFPVLTENKPDQPVEPREVRVAFQPSWAIEIGTKLIYNGQGEGARTFGDPETLANFRAAVDAGETIDGEMFEAQRWAQTGGMTIDLPLPEDGRAVFEAEMAAAVRSGEKSEIAAVLDRLRRAMEDTAERGDDQAGDDTL